MNARQRRFCEEYALNPNATQSAIQAGFSPKTAYSIGQRLLKNVEIMEYIQQLQLAAESERVANISEIKQFWTHVMRDEEIRTDLRLKASELLAKSALAFVDTTKVTTDDEVEEYPDVIFYLPENGRPIITDLEETE